MKMEKLFLAAVVAMFSVSANAQYQHGLPANEKQAKPTVLNVGRPYSYKALKVYEDSGMQVEVYYDAKTHREYNKNLSTGQITLQIPETVDGKPVITVYAIDHKDKTCRVQMRLSGAVADTRPPHTFTGNSSLGWFVIFTICCKALPNSVLALALRLKSCVQSLVIFSNPPVPILEAMRFPPA